MTRRGTSIVAALFLISVFPPCAAGQDPCSTEQTPARVRELLKEKFPGWKIVTLSQLNPDDQEIWKKTNPHKRPGFVAGNFQGTGRSSYAFNLFRQDRKALFEVLVVIDPDGEDYKLHVLSKPQETAILGVIAKYRPGTYTDFYDTKRIKTTFPVISYEAIGDGQLVYYWANGRYHSVQTSD